MFLRIAVLVLGLSLAFPAIADMTPSGPVSPGAIMAVQPAPAVVPDAPPPPPIEHPTLPAAPPVNVTYIAPTFPDILRTLVRFNALDLRDNNLIDDYARVTDCEIYKYFYKDDFKWEEIRKKIRASTDLHMSDYPVHYYYATGVKLDRYDFEKKMYSLTEATAIQAVNLFTLYETQMPSCPNEDVRYIPKSYQAVADTPFTLVGLPLTPADAQALLRQMSDDKNTSHIIIVQFNITITSVESLRKEVIDPGAKGKDMQYSQIVDIDGKTSKNFRLDAHIDSVNFYEDAAMKKLIYTIKP